jgi:hypothetical protein
MGAQISILLKISDNEKMRNSARFYLAVSDWLLRLSKSNQDEFLSGIREALLLIYSLGGDIAVRKILQAAYDSL